jgi:hypothetical protein
VPTTPLCCCALRALLRCGRPAPPRCARPRLTAPRHDAHRHPRSAPLGRPAQTLVDGWKTVSSLITKLQDILDSKDMTGGGGKTTVTAEEYSA